MEKSEIAQVMELLEAVHEAADKGIKPGTVDSAAYRSVVNNCLGLVSDIMKAEWEKNNAPYDPAIDEEFDGMAVRWEDLDHSHDAD